MLEPTLAPPQSKPHVSVARMKDHWYVVGRSRQVKPGGILPVTLLGIPLVLFRTREGALGALLDRCPHRNIPLSEGRVIGDRVQCAYHGWQFGTGGQCLHIPGLLSDHQARGRDAVRFPVREQQSYIWIFASSELEPVGPPYEIPALDDARYTHSHRWTEAEGTLHATIENALDVPHTAFLHKGLFRGGAPHEIEVIVRRWADRVEAQYVGEPRPSGLVARLLAPSGGEVTHFDRFILPSIAQVDYSLGEDTRILVTTLCTPVSDFHTVLHAVVSFRMGRLPGWLVKPVLEPIARKIFAQDARILKLQSDTIRRFGGEQFASTEIDVLGQEIWRLMRAAERGDTRADDSPPVEKRLRMTA